MVFVGIASNQRPTRHSDIARQSRDLPRRHGGIDKAKAAFAAAQRLAPRDYFARRLEGASPYARPDDRNRQRIFMRIAAGLEDPSVADALRLGDAS